MPSRSTAWIGIPPATLASIARLILALIARSQISAPHCAISSLFAVTTDFPLAMAPSMISCAVVVPPTSSATISTFGWLTISRQSVVRKTSPEGVRQRLLRDGTAANGGDGEPETQLERDLFRVCRKDGEGAGADISQADQAYLNVFHLIQL